MSFEQIKGQDKPIQLLKDYLNHNRLASAYLFLGPEGIGKGLVAKTLAKAVNCLEGNLESCDNCTSCLKIDKAEHPDFHLLGRQAADEVRASDAIKIEEIFQLQKEINLKPYEGRKKVFIIDNAHHLTAEASNALLKVLEEPPANSLIILISAKPTLLFKTIISRCQVIKFSPLPRSILEGLLKKDYALPPQEAHFLSFFSEGRLGRALKLKEADIFQEKNALIDDFVAVAAAGQEESLAKNRDRLRRSLNILVTWFRDLYLIKSGSPHAELINLDRKDRLLQLMNRYSFSELDEVINYISDSLLYLEQNINTKLLLSYLGCFMRS